MNKRRVFLSISWGTILFTTTWIVLLSFLATTPVYADNCLDDITNLADCMRTPVIREVITVGAGLLGVTPVVFVNLLSNLGALNPLPGLLSKITKSSTATSILSDLWDRVKPVIQQLSPDLVKRIERYFARSAGSKLAERTSAILDALDKSSKSGSSSTSKQKTPVKGPTPVKVPSGGSGASGGSGGTGGSGGAGGSGGTGGKSGTPYKGPVKELDVKIFDGKDAHQILKALGLIKPGVPPEGQITVSRSDLDKLLGMHPSGDPIQLTLRSGKKVIINSVKGIAFDSDGVPGGDPGTLDFTKGISIAAEVVEPAPPPPPVPPGPGPGGAAPGGGPGGGPGGKPGGGAAPGGSRPGGKSAAGGKKPDSLMGQQFEGDSPQGSKSPSSDQDGSGKAGEAGGEGSVIDDQAASSATDDF